MPSAFQRVHLLEGDNNKERSSCKIQKDSRSVANIVGAGGIRGVGWIPSVGRSGETGGNRVVRKLTSTLAALQFRESRAILLPDLLRQPCWVS